ncbi:hypothetical protein EXIGLDRAFT_828814 [Exidia glandulosa HHB12029]|uniref:DUF6533 domain-containing protein n=1 Tax=Exidia glandulosa HHB12029 TaxID=1314781 RepID=A0A165Q488_EXIGL|nr:hypothetical protein EXIGLDRAFT_828814 [Exidia glandulosa HHB12029]
MDPSELIDAAYFGQVTRWNHVAAYSLMVYDWLLCYDVEYKFIFESKFSLAKLAYLLCRYYFLLSHPISLWVQFYVSDPTLCQHVYNLPIFLGVPNLIFTEAILILRTYAFTGGKKAVLVSLSICLVVPVVYQVWVGTASAMMPGGHGCFPVDVGKARHLSGTFLSMVLYDVLITVVFFGYAFRVLNFELGLATPLTKLFMREGFVYFVCITAINIANSILNFQSNGALGTVGVPMSLSLPSVLCCRLVLNLRHFADPDRDPMSSNDKSMSTHQSFEMAHAPSHQSRTSFGINNPRRSASAVLAQVRHHGDEPPSTKGGYMPPQTYTAYKSHEQLVHWSDHVPPSARGDVYEV